MLVKRRSWWRQEINWPALNRFEKAQYPDHTPDFVIVNQLRLLKASRVKYIKAEEAHPRALGKDGVNVTNQHPKLPLLVAKYVLSRLKAGLRR